MPAVPTALPDTGQIGANNILDNLLGTAGGALDVWSKWQASKTQNLIDKASIPSTATPTGVAATPSGIDQKTLLIGGALVLGVGAALLIARR